MTGFWLGQISSTGQQAADQFTDLFSSKSKSTANLSEKKEMIAKN